MENNDFRLFEKHVRTRNTSAVQIPAMADIVEVEFRKGSASIFYKTTFKENEYTEVDFFMSKYKHTYKCFPERKRQDNRGITFKKKEGIHR